MDAFDIFKKLSAGAKFKRKVVANSTDKNKKVKTENNVETFAIKQEIVDVDKLEATIKIKSEPFETEQDESDRHLTLLGSITATESGKKKKKKKEKILDEDKIKALEKEKINQYRNQQHINIVGQHAPPPIQQFEDLPINKDLIKNLAKCGYEFPTPIQKQAIPVMLNKRQILACAPTGSGKTAAFLIPIIHHLREPQRKGFRAVIVCPTRELARQTQRECTRLAEGRGFRIHVLNKINIALNQLGPKSNQKFDILATTPNRLCYLLQQEPPAISLANVEWLVIDEADKLFEEGLRGFREQLDQIMAACTFKELRIAMFSATQTVDVGRWCKKNMKRMIGVTIGQRNSATDLVEQELLFVGNESGKLVAFRNIVQKGLAPPVLVFVQSKDRAQQLFNELIYDGINVDVIHANRSQTQRDNTVRSFREGKIWVLICTELMARGIDFKGVNLVINYDFPPSAIAYIHRIGRAGRAGRKGKAVTFFTTDDTTHLRSIAQVLKQSGCDIPKFMITMKKKRSKRDKNKVIEREDITTKPKFIRDKIEEKRNRYVKPIPNKNDNDDMLMELASKNKTAKNKFKKPNNNLKNNQNKSKKLKKSVHSKKM